MGWESALQRIRVEHGISQAEAADRSGISRQTYRLVEGGHRKPFITTRYRIARFVREVLQADGEPEVSLDDVVKRLWS